MTHAKFELIDKGECWCGVWKARMCTCNVMDYEDVIIYVSIEMHMPRGLLFDIGVFIGLLPNIKLPKS